MSFKKPEAVKDLRACALKKAFKGREVVSSVDITVKAGEVVGLLGPNGAGKSTTFYMIVGRILPDSGNVFLGDEDVTSLPMYLRSRGGIGYLPQEASIFRSLSVRENLDLVLQELGYSDAERIQNRDRLIDELGLHKIVAAPGYALSGGERRRVEIARCLALSPIFILLDEPFSGIDPVAVNDIQEIIIRLKNSGYGILLTDHNVRETLGICDKAFIISSGEVIASGTPDEIVSNESVRKVYLGEHFRM